MPGQLRLGGEMSGVKTRYSRPRRDGWMGNGRYYVYQEGGNVVAERKGER